MGDLSKDLFSDVRPYPEGEWGQDERIPLEGIDFPAVEQPSFYAQPPASYPQPVVEPYPRLVRGAILCGAAAGSWAIVIVLVLIIRR